jgi:hypothetical protein
VVRERGLGALRKTAGARYAAGIAHTIAENRVKGHCQHEFVRATLVSARSLRQPSLGPRLASARLQIGARNGGQG